MLKQRPEASVLPSWRYTLIEAPQESKSQLRRWHPRATSGINDTNGGVVGRELLVLLERLAKGVQPLVDQVFQTAYTRI